jgi:hypothetical protein
LMSLRPFVAPVVTKSIATMIRSFRATLVTSPSEL